MYEKVKKNILYLIQFILTDSKYNLNDIFIHLILLKQKFTE